VKISSRHDSVEAIGEPVAETAPLSPDPPIRLACMAGNVDAGAL
jgi:hypothetical protein